MAAQKPSIIQHVQEISVTLSNLRGLTWARDSLALFILHLFYSTTYLERLIFTLFYCPVANFAAIAVSKERVSLKDK